MAKQDKNLKPIWGESLLTREEWKSQFHLLRNTYSRSTPPQMFDCEFKWRHGMGANLLSNEIESINDNLNYILKKARDERNIIKATIST